MMAGFLVIFGDADGADIITAGTGADDTQLNIFISPVA